MSEYNTPMELCQHIPPHDNNGDAQGSLFHSQSWSFVNMFLKMQLTNPHEETSGQPKFCKFALQARNFQACARWLWATLLCMCTGLKWFLNSRENLWSFGWRDFTPGVPTLNLILWFSKMINDLMSKITADTKTTMSRNRNKQFLLLAIVCQETSTIETQHCIIIIIVHMTLQ